MNKKYRKSVFIFRRDLRVEDNIGLIEALRSSEYVMPCFIIDPRQVEDNEYKSERAVQFMFNSLKELDLQLKKRGGRLYVFKGQAEDVVNALIRTETPDAVFMNKDYTPFSIKRDDVIEQNCLKKKIDFNIYNDALLNTPEFVMKDDNTAYSVFTYFHKKALHIPVSKPVSNVYKNFYNQLNEDSDFGFIDSLTLKPDYGNHVHGGRSETMSLFDGLENLVNYETERDYPALNNTSKLSAHIKFGTVSIREVYRAIAESLGSASPLIRQLYWRDFFTSVGYFYPWVFEGAFHRKYNSIVWENDEDKFESWKRGLTGFPIVDAGMRQLNETGYMHNRVRMITASFLVKDLHIDWRWGEKYFAQKLIDYDPCLNNGNWQWSASTGCDAQPYFRIFNPWNQQKKFDRDCVYIKQWIPELKNIDSIVINNLDREYEIKHTEYPPPMLDHKIAIDRTLEMYKQTGLTEGV